MRAEELKTIPAEDVLAYVKSIHNDFHLPDTILTHPKWRKTRVPLNRLHVPDPESGEDLDDPYNRVQMIDMYHVDDITRQDIERRPIVVDTDGHIIDGNHRALAARLGGLFDIPAYVPIQQAVNEEEKLLDPDLYGEMLPTATVGRIVRAVVAEVDPSAVVKVKGSPEGYYIVSTDNDKLQFDFGITAQGGEISANIVNAYAREDYLGTGIVTKIIDLCFKAMVKKYGRPEKFVIGTQEDKGHGVWQHIAQKLGAEWGGSMMENFADGKGPGRPGDSQRHGIPKGATMAELEKASHSAGRKGQLARWQLNMRRSHKK